MENYDLSLFNQQTKLQIVQQVNQLLQLNNQSFSLTTVDVEEVLDNRDQALKDYQLIDFSLANTLHFMEQAAQERRMVKNEYLTMVEVLQESFYYLHSLQPAEDETLWEKIQEIYEKFDGNLEYVQGYIEDFPTLKEDD
ncbi:DUF6323 family protein [Candidatus Enterococcus ferrettii]|uniref:Uncharacterized protein n=1 Tax=Candidatus Enterococcus ferrettii TaxID=2815324 RepID=A0ABV0F119_9ENTE|nr:DUF6323 family protein [Enterococcus sp. 665A]MBO1340878.1 hypothetical protein [Enterococcus sp. 665A]